MPEGVEHPDGQLAKCAEALVKKALSTSSLSSSGVISGRVKKAVMPEGVEHGAVILNRGGVTRVKKAVMPEGVEHP